jgi:hypothetical protein
MRSARCARRRPALVPGLMAALIAALAALVVPASAGATTVTLGPTDLGTGSLQYNCQVGGLSPCTSESFVHETVPGGAATAPGAGVITAWRVRGAVTGGSIELVVLGNATGTGYTSRAISGPAANLDGTPNQVSLPVQAGDRVAATLISGSGAAAINQVSAPGAQLRFFSPGFTAANQTMSSSNTISDVLAAFNADLVLAPPSNQFSFGSLKRNKRKGTAILAVNVSHPGTLNLSGKGVKSVRTTRGSGAVASKAVAAAGTVKLLIRAKGQKKRTLNKTGKVKVKVNVTYTPTGGSPNTRFKRVKLIKKR